jgi:hypothetical protein
MSTEEKELLKNAARDRNAFEVTPFGRRRRRNSAMMPLRQWGRMVIGLLRQTAQDRIAPPAPVVVPIPVRARRERGE